MSALRFASLAALALAVGCGDPAAGSERGMVGGSGASPSGGEGSLGPDGSGGLIGPDGQPSGPGPAATDAAGPDASGNVPQNPDDPDVLGAGPANPDPSASAPSGEVVDVPDLPADADPVTTTDVFAGSRIRRLTNVEYANTLSDLFGVSIDLDSLPLDTRQNDFTRNVAQAVDPVLGGHLQSTAQEVADEVVSSGLDKLVPCASSGDRACAQTFLEGFGARVYRRPLESSEVESLLALYDAGADGQSNPFASGMNVVLQAMLQSASFLYLSEMGPADAGPGEVVMLGPYELASSLSYLLTAHPPDDELLAAAEDGSILQPDVRQSEAMRLLASPAAEQQIQRFVKQWLGLDSVSKIDKADPNFGALRGPVEDEANRFISAIAVNGDGRLSTMLTAGYTYVGPEMASFYGITPDASGRADLTGTGRLGLLQTAAFLAANSHNDNSAPVVRGVTVLRKVLCYNMPSPADSPDPQLRNIMPPPRDDTMTTRERFDQHAQDDACIGCHSVIDSIGFTFEDFDAIGALRTEENGKPVDTSGALQTGSSEDGDVADSVELVKKIAAEPRTAECFARQVYRNGMGDATKDAEDTFIRSLGDGTVTDDVKELLTELSGSNSFLLRRTPTADEQL